MWHAILTSTRINLCSRTLRRMFAMVTQAITISEPTTAKPLGTHPGLRGDAGWSLGRNNSLRLISAKM